MIIHAAARRVDSTLMVIEIKLMAGVDLTISFFKMTHGRQSGRDMASPLRVVGDLHGFDNTSTE
jgi:hypothetical protein